MVDDSLLDDVQDNARETEQEAHSTQGVMRL